MRIPVALLSLAAVVSFSLPPAARAQELKIGYVDLQRALDEVEEGKSAKAQLKKDFDQKQKMLDERQEELKRLKADLDKQAAVLSEEAKRSKQADLEGKFMEVQQLFVQLQKQLSEAERKMTRGIFEKMSGIVREIAESEKITMVFEKTDAGLLYAPASYDLTNDLVRRYNAKYKGGGGAAPPKKSAKNEKGK